jgi:hypothetical protein
MNWSDADLKAWAYDPDRALIDEDDVDEDLLLGSLPDSVILPLIADPNCDKASYLLSCLDRNCMFAVLRSDDLSRTRVPKSIEAAAAYSHRPLDDWVILQRRRLRYWEGVGLVDRGTALTMADDLLKGMCRFGDVAINDDHNNGAYNDNNADNDSSAYDDEWTIEYTAGGGSHREVLTISKRHGTFRYLGSQPPMKPPGRRTG